MLSATKEVATLTLFNDSCLEETVEDRYNRCGLLNIIQHIDIFGKFRSSYVEQRSREYSSFHCVSSISSTSSNFFSDSSVSSLRNVESKLSRFSISTKLSGLYPGNDILGKKKRAAKHSNSDVIFGTLVPR